MENSIKNNMKRNKKRNICNKKGFTLVEILVVIFIIGILIVALYPRLSTSNLNSHIDTAEADLRVFSLNINNYMIDYGGIYVKDCTTLPLADADPTVKTFTTETTKLVAGLNAYLNFSVEDVPITLDNTQVSGVDRCKVVLETKIKNDPWNSKYQILLDTLNSVVIIASPGPDAFLTTDTYSTGDFGDDILVIVKAK